MNKARSSENGYNQYEDIFNLNDVYTWLKIVAKPNTIWNKKYN